MVLGVPAMQDWRVMFPLDFPIFRHVPRAGRRESQICLNTEARSVAPKTPERQPDRSRWASEGEDTRAADSKGVLALVRVPHIHTTSRTPTMRPAPSETVGSAMEVVAEETQVGGLSTSPTPMYPPRFDPTDTDGFTQYMNEHGFAVVAGVLDTDAVTTGKRFFWDFMEQGDPDGPHHGPTGDAPPGRLRRDDPSTWSDARWAERVSIPHIGLVNTGGMSHSDFAWHLRLQPKVKSTFATLWGTDRLLTSFDGACAFRPWSGPAGRPEWKTQGGWYHLDQGNERPGKCCIQGLVLYTDATPHSGGLVVVPGSHKDFNGLLQRNTQTTYGDFVSIAATDPVLAQGSARLVCARAGDLVLWDSRTVHCSSPGVVDTPEETPRVTAGPLAPVELLRICGYVCMTPARWASASVRSARREAFETKCGTSHWPHTFTSCQDGLVETEGRRGLFALAPPEVRALVDGGEDLD
eukprot:m.160412 g.160412  ORF g.160412 m.160412 type:complete len:466 (+) comp11945_c0_seq1:190-1587(+)